MLDVWLFIIHQNFSLLLLECDEGVVEVSFGCLCFYVLAAESKHDLLMFHLFMNRAGLTFNVCKLLKGNDLQLSSHIVCFKS